MATGESAFNAFLPVKGFTNLVTNTKVTAYSEEDSRIIKIKTDSLPIAKDLEGMKYNLVNSTIKKKEKVSTPKLSFHYLVNACKMIKKSEVSPKLAKKTYESQSIE